MNKALSKIIVTDDDPDILMIARFSLDQLYNVSVKYCQSGQETIQEATKFLPDLILIDVTMPIMDGVETLHILKQNPLTSHIPVIFLTAKTAEMEIVDYHKLGAFDVLTKPFDPLQLGNTIIERWEKFNHDNKKIKK